MEVRKNNLDKTDIFREFPAILKEELTPAFGCTEPIAIAYCASKLRDVLGCAPESVVVEASGNIIKNVKSVIVPNTGGLKGIAAAAAAGIAAGRTEKELEVIADVSQEDKAKICSCLEKTDFQIKALEDGDKLDIRMTGKGNGHTALVRVAKRHANIVRIERDGAVLLEEGGKTAKKENAAELLAAECPEAPAAGKKADRSGLSVANIAAYAEAADLSEIQETLDRQIAYNYAIAQEGLAHEWGANIGSVLLKSRGNDVRNRAAALAAAGSDARMSGCELPVVINSGSGNQGITVSVPVIEYAKHMGVSKETLYRALIVSNLVAIHLKAGIGPLSAFCGAVSAGCAAGCGIAWLCGGRLEEISHTLVNSIAIVSGIVCDGAKPSCAGKIAASVDAGILGYDMYCQGQQFYAEDGIVSKGVENTIRNIYRLGAQGMCETDEEIIRIMTDCG